MANRTIDSPYNTVGPQEWLNQWSQMLVPGTYERGIFGDLMLPGIACGVRKVLLIFNTNPNTPHDPIYVVNPSDFNIQPDTEIPIVLAYNMSHYESMEPCSDYDIEATINLVREYQEGRYRYGRADIESLLTIRDKNQQKQVSKESNDKMKPRKVPEDKANFGIQNNMNREFEEEGEIQKNTDQNVPEANHNRKKRSNKLN